MKKLLLLFFTIISLQTFAQFPITQTLGSPSTLVKSKGALGVDSGFVFLKNYPDTATANLGFIKNIPNIVVTINDQLWKRNNAATRWEQIGSFSQTIADLLYEPIITAGTSSQYWRGDKTWQTLDKAAVGLSNVDNTSDANKPVSSAQQTALDLKQDLLNGSGLVKSTAGTISYISDNSANWNTAFGWGDHSVEGYLTSYTETDPVFLASDVADITLADIGNWNTAFGWGDHDGLYSLLSHNHDLVYEPLFSKNTGFNKDFGSTAGTVAEGNDSRILNGQTAFGWGDHSTEDYLTNITGLVDEGTNVTITGTGTAGDPYVINAASGGEVNTASNLGGGLANYSTKSGVDLQFNSFNSTDFDLASNLISIDATLKSTWNGKMTNPMTSTGDIIYSSDGSGTPARLAAGTNGHVLTLASGVPTWAAASGSSTTINNNADNRIITGSGTANTLEAESSLTFDGNIFTIQPASNVTDLIHLNNSAGTNVMQIGVNPIASSVGSIWFSNVTASASNYGIQGAWNETVVNNPTAVKLKISNADALVVNSTKEVLIGSSTDFGAYNLQVTGNTYQGGFISITEQAAPSTPAAGRVTIYPKTDGLLYAKDDAGVERSLNQGFVFTPANSTDATHANGTITVDDTYIYFRTSTGTWKKIALSAF